MPGAMKMAMLDGELIIGSARVRGTGTEVRGYDPARGEALEPRYGGATAEDIERACALADAAFDAYRETSPEQRARFLERIAERLLESGDALVERAMQESGLPRARLEGERARTVGQLRLFAAVVREGSWLDARIDPALPDRKPLPRPDLRLRNIPLGPVAVFGASNFPLAFSVAGGDTASALAAGCPVVVKAHPAHPGTSEIAGRAIQAAAQDCGLPEGVFSMLYGAGNEVGAALVAHPFIKAVGFTGSRAGGLALLRIAQQRPEPIPVFAEMSSVNPVLVFPAALAARGAAIAKGFVASLTMGAGQFCTNPGLVLGVEGAPLDGFEAEVGKLLPSASAATMLTAGICDAYARGVSRLSSHPRVRSVARGQPVESGHGGQAAFFSTAAADFLADPVLQEEVFGASSLLVRCRDVRAMRDVLQGVEGQLTITLQIDPEDEPLARELLPLLERKAGRILVNGFPTGVEVAHAMVHGGPFPATSDSRTTSVGSLAIRRFLRPVCYQDFPKSLLPAVVRNENPQQVPRLVDGRRLIHPTTTRADPSSPA
ncbi:MAG TPA: aldehyde dehydrogenase (NADP(+)) [Usitatibacter sp.]|nr:aldehyde dehydrogenase (NADP(+)) [Usitatibacter sp.]